MSTGSRDQAVRSTRRLAILVGGIVPTVIAVGATALMVMWLPELPDPIAVHWSGAGPDGFGAALPFALTPLVVVVLFSAFAVAVAWRTGPAGGPLFNQKIVLASSVWLSVLLGVVFVGSIAGQRGLTDAKDAPDVGVLLAIAVLAAFVFATAAWFVLPRGESSATEGGQPPKRVDVRGEERLSWSRTARFGNAVLLIVGASILLAAGVAFFAARASQSSAILAIAVLLFVSVLVATNVWWRVTADFRGLSVRGVLGWPSKRIPLRNIRTVQVVEVTPIRDFGGYGWRWAADGRSGVILRAGSAIEVTVSSGKRFVVTVDDAETGAGVIAGLLTQAAKRET